MESFQIEDGILRKYLSNGKCVDTLEIPEGVTEIAMNAIYGNHCKKLILPKSLKKIAMRGICSYGESKLREVEFLGDVDEIGNDAFSGIPLDKITFNGTVGTIGKMAFHRANVKRLSITVDKIEANAFYGCDKLEELHLYHVKALGNGAFEACKKLKVLDIPETLTNIGDNAFRRCDKLVDEKNMIIINNIFFLPVAKHYNEIPEGVVCIDKFATNVNMAKIMKLPSTLRTFKEQSIYGRFAFPVGLLQTSDKLSGKGFIDCIEYAWKKEMVARDWAALYLFQTGKQYEELFSNYMKEDANVYLTEMISLLEEKKAKAKNYEKCAEYILVNKDVLSQENIKTFYEKATANKAPKAAALVKSYIATEEPVLEEKESIEQPSIKDPCEVLKGIFEEHLLNKAFKKHKGTEKLLEEVLLLDGTKAPSFLAKCAIVPYLEQYTGRPKHISSYKYDTLEVKLVEEADKAAALLQMSSLRDVLTKLYQKSGSAWLLPYCHYASREQILEVISDMKKWEEWYIYGSTGRSDIIIARSGLMLSNIREAMMSIEKAGRLETYASIRGTDADSIRDTMLAEFGLDEEGKKSYDLGSKTVVASLKNDLTFELFDTVAQKIVKSMPKKGADEELFAKASTDFSEMKKNVKKVVKSRNDLLFDDFLSGRTRNALGWKTSYLGNALLRQVAQLVVWNQGKDSFIVTKDDVIDSNGNSYEIKENVAIGVAHPREMAEEDIKNWQQYFCDNKLKQPFEQIWEPVVKKEDIKSDRYKDCQISVFKFMKQEKHGITFGDENFHEVIWFELEDCELEHERTTFYRHDIGKDETFTLGAFKIEKYTRVTNHIVYLLDKWTVGDRIAKDDSSIVEILGSFTLAQIMGFIDLAMESNSTTCLAALMEYKNEHFSDFDIMDVFTLD